MTCYLIRHGKDDDSIRGGWSDAPLTQEGVCEVRVLSTDLAVDTNMNITHIFSSDLVRARQTAEIISQELNITVQYLPDFREVNNGELAGMKNDLAAQMYPGLYWNTLGWNEHYPHGESPHEFFDRVSNAWEDFKRKMRNTDGNIMLVTHGGVINVICHIEKEIPYSNQNPPFPVKNCGMVAIEID